MSDNMPAQRAPYKRISLAELGEILHCTIEASVSDRLNWDAFHVPDGETIELVRPVHLVFTGKDWTASVPIAVGHGDLSTMIRTKEGTDA